VYALAVIMNGGTLGCF